MKRLLQIFITITVVGTSAFNVIACSKKYIFDSSVWVITDGGTISDFSFNQTIWEGANEFVALKRNPKLSLSQLKNSKLRASFFEPVNNTSGDFKSAYITSSIAGAKTLVLPGFNHGNTLGWAAGLVDNVIYIDGNGQGTRVNMDPNGPLATNIIGITYQAETSGFFASLAASIHLNAYQKEYDNQLKIGSYGGMDNPIAVSNYMWGFLIGADIFNAIINSVPGQKLNYLKDEFLKQVKLINNEITTLQPIFKVQNVLNRNESWFSQSFQAGEGKVISDELLSRGAKIIFPVAGVQVQDTINQIRNNKVNAKIVGVDTNQSEIYGKDIVVTSALKQLSTSTIDALNNIYSSKCGYNLKNNSWNKKNRTKECWIDSDQTSIDNPSWTGIETTKWVKKDLVNFLHNKTNDQTKDTPFDKMVKVLQYAYKDGINNNPPIVASTFPETLQNTYQNQTTLKEYLLSAIENLF